MGIKFGTLGGLKATSLALVVGTIQLLPSANAQMGGAEGSYIPEPTIELVDGNGVSLTSWTISVKEPMVAIGDPQSGGLFFQATRKSSYQEFETFQDGRAWSTNNFDIRISWQWDCTDLPNAEPCAENPDPGGNVLVVSGAGNSLGFTGTGAGPYAKYDRNGDTLYYDSAANEYRLVTKNGTKYFFQGSVNEPCSTCTGPAFADPYPHHQYRVSRIEKPDGEVITFHYNHALVDYRYKARLQSVTNNLGYQIHFEYASNSATTEPQLANYFKPSKVTAINNSVYSCAPTAFTCLATGGGVDWPRITYGSENGVQIDTVTDNLGRVTRYVYYIHYNANGKTLRRLEAVRSPQSPSTNDLSFSWSTTGIDLTVTGASGTWVYDYNGNYLGNSSSNDTFVTVQGPNGYVRSVQARMPAPNVVYAAE